MDQLRPKNSGGEAAIRPHTQGIPAPHDERVLP